MHSLFQDNFQHIKHNSDAFFFEIQLYPVLVFKYFSTNILYQNAHYDISSFLGLGCVSIQIQAYIPTFYNVDKKLETFWQK